MKKLISLASILTTAAVFAAPQPQVECISFSTVGPDTYADGTTVADGECYALVWSADGNFDGILADGTAKDAADRILLVAACAKDGKCPEKLVQIATDVKFGDTLASAGTYAVYLLDTRKYTGEKTEGDQPAFTVGKGNPVNAAEEAIGGIKAKGSSVDNSKTTTGSVAATTATALPAEIAAPKITGMTMGAETITLEVSGTSAYVNYAAAASTTPGATPVATGAPQVGNNGTITLIVPKPAGNTGFFQVNRK